MSSDAINKIVKQEVPVEDDDSRVPSLPIRKRKKATSNAPDPSSERSSPALDEHFSSERAEGNKGRKSDSKTDETGDAGLKGGSDEGYYDSDNSSNDDDGSNGNLKPLKRAPMSKAREVRLEQNRKAARESRRRKKVMIEELQRSVIFFSRANGTLKQQNDELQRLYMQAQAQVQAIESGQASAPATLEAQVKEEQQGGDQNHGHTQNNNNNNSAQDVSDANEQGQQSSATSQAQAHFQFSNLAQQAQAAQAAAMQAMYESQGFPSAAARTAAQTFAAGPSIAAASGSVGTASANLGQVSCNSTNDYNGGMNNQHNAQSMISGNHPMATFAPYFQTLMSPGQNGAPVVTSGPAPGPTGIDAFNAFAMQQYAPQFAAQFSLPQFAVQQNSSGGMQFNPALFQQQQAVALQHLQQMGGWGQAQNSSSMGIVGGNNNTGQNNNERS